MFGGMTKQIRVCNWSFQYSAIHLRRPGTNLTHIHIYTNRQFQNDRYLTDAIVKTSTISFEATAHLQFLKGICIFYL